jgi:hypothetical protein
MMVVIDSGSGGGGDVIIITQSTGGASSSTSSMSGLHSGSTSQLVDNHKDMATEPVGSIFKVYDPVLANLFGVYV